MIDNFLLRRDEERNKIKYQKPLGYKVLDEDGDRVNVHITVLDVMWGYNVYYHGETTKMIGWFRKSCEAVEFAVDTARKMIAEHEKAMVNRQAIDHQPSTGPFYTDGKA